jgi:release factor glutamine methyltransferase
LRRAACGGRDFRAAGIESPELDARHRRPRASASIPPRWPRPAHALLTPSEQNAITALAQRRLNREPVARIVGQKEFWSLTLRLDSATLVPRPETETVVEAALAAIDAHGFRSGSLRIADLGTGSGALALALLSELPHASPSGPTKVLTRLLPPALMPAVSALIAQLFVACDMAQALRGPFDVIVVESTLHRVQ